MRFPEISPMVFNVVKKSYGMDRGPNDRILPYSVKNRPSGEPKPRAPVGHQMFSLFAPEHETGNVVIHSRIWKRPQELNECSIVASRTLRCLSIVRC